MSKSIKSLAAQVATNKFKLLPLECKYYGTKLDGIHGSLDIWMSDHFAVPFGSEREIANGWVPEDGHDHIEDKNSLEIAQFLELAPQAVLTAVDKLNNLLQIMKHEENADPNMRMDYSSMVSEIIKILDDPEELISNIIKNMDQ